MRYPSSVASEDAAERRLRRANIEVQVFRPGDEEAAADYDALYWDRIPVNERAAFAWDLSAEQFALSRRSSEGIAHEDERRSPRSIARVFRR